MSTGSQKGVGFIGGNKRSANLTLEPELLYSTASSQGRSLAEIVADVNRSLQGWHGYFQHSQASTFATVAGRCATTLAEPAAMAVGWAGQGNRGGSSPRWPNAWFARRALLSLAAEHVWTRTIVATRTH
jgi:RNA-directed DNA polymerase